MSKAAGPRAKSSSRCADLPPNSPDETIASEKRCSFRAPTAPVRTPWRQVARGYELPNG
jgi:hypothetical protein